MGCSPLLLRFPLPGMLSFLASILLLVQQLDLLLLFCLLLLLKLLLEHLLLLVLELPLSILPVQDGIADHFSTKEVHGVVADKVLDGFPAIVDLTKLDKEWDQVDKLLIFYIIVPGYDWDGLLRLQHVSRRRVVKNDGILGTSADFTHVFCEDALHVGAVLTEEAGCAEAIGIHLVHQGVSVLGQTRREYNDLVIVGHHSEEIVDAGPLLNEDLADVAFDVDRNDEVGVLDLIELTVHQCLIKIQYQRLHALASVRWWTQQAPARLLLPLVIASLGPCWNLDVTTLRFRPVLRRVLLGHHGHRINLSLRHLCHHSLQLLHRVYIQNRGNVID